VANPAVDLLRVVAAGVAGHHVNAHGRDLARQIFHRFEHRQVAGGCEEERRVRFRCRGFEGFEERSGPVGAKEDRDKDRHLGRGRKRRR